MPAACCHWLLPGEITGFGAPWGGAGQGPRAGPEAYFKNRSNLLGGAALRLQTSEEQVFSVLFPNEETFRPEGPFGSQEPCS